MKKYDEYDDELFKSSIRELVNKDTANRIKSKVEEFMHLMTYYKCAMMELETKLQVLNEEFSLEEERNPISSIKSRLKTPQSIANKLQALKLDATLDNLQEINDIAGVRVICNFESDVYSIADALLKQDDITLVSKKDYVKNPKPNGYRSLHIIVSLPIFLSHEKKEMKVEVQIRSIAMDVWANMEHQMLYKKNIILTHDSARELQLCAQLSKELDQRMDSLRKIIKEQSYIIPVKKTYNSVKKEAESKGQA